MGKLSTYFKADKQLVQLPVEGLEADMINNETVGQPAIPFVIEKAFTGAAAETHIFNAAVPFKMKVLDVSVQITTAGAAAAAITATIDDGTDAITDAMAVNASGTAVAVDTIVRAGKVVSTKATLAAGSTLDVTLSATTNAPAGVVRITAVPVA
jgi:hypothetical protein